MMIIRTHDDHPTAFTKDIILSFGHIKPVSSITSRVERFISELALNLKNSGCRLIGHIKGLIDANENGYLFCSLVTFHGKPRFKGTLQKDIEDARLTLNIIVYGIEPDIVEDIVQQGIKNHFE
ncbi:MAG: hypothetical protein KJ737_03835 [Proteobacteria bacterium]|nr:hypothetical protein [Pseudomonadota bacterium]